MLQAILIKWALDATLDLVEDILEEKVKDRKSQISKPILDIVKREKTDIRNSILKKIKK